MDRKTQQEIFDRWMNCHIAVVVRVARGFASGADCEDLIQEIMLAVWKSVPAYSNAAQASTFIYRVAHNAALTWHRSQRRLLPPADDVDQVRDGPATQPRISSGDDRMELVYSAIRQLQEADRTLILLSLDGLSYRELSNITGLSESNVGARLHRIKKQLTTILKGQDLP